MKNLRAAIIALCLFPMLCVPMFALPVQLQDPTTQRYIGSSANPVPVTISGTGTGSSNVTVQQGGSNLSATNPIFSAPDGVAQASIVNTTAAIAAADTAVALGTACRHVIIKSDVGAAAIYVDLANGTATTADFKIDPGGSIYYYGQAISSFHYIGASAAGNISVLAW